MADMSQNKFVHRLILEHRKAAAEAEAIIENANLEGREMNDDEKAQFKTLVEHASRYKAQLDAERENMAFRKQISDIADTGAEGFPEGAFAGQKGIAQTANPSMSVGELFTKSSVFKALQEAHRNGNLPESYKTPAVAVPYSRKAAESPVLESNAESLFGDGSQAGPVTTLLPGVETPGLRQRRPTIAALLPVIPITLGNSATYRIAKNVTRPGSGDEPITEGQEKFELKYEFDVVTNALEKLAAYTKISEEFLEDDATVAAFINADLPYQIRQVEEKRLGLALYASTSDAVPLATGSTLFDEILAAMTEIQDAGFEPDGMIITATNWAELRAEKFTGGTGGYVGGGPFSPTANPWGLTVAISSAAVDDHPLIGDFANGAKLYRKGALSVSATNSNEDDFINNLVTIRAELRELVGVTYPEAFVTADISGS